MASDPNKRHFKREQDFAGIIAALEPELRAEFIDFLVSSLTSNFPAASSMPKWRGARPTPT
jgi:magnesium-protoporphyrin IX monomethyl ester (oxidative) cyclase